jgi:aminomethyltransferase
MKKTVLYNKHIELNGKMVPFAGYMMPVQFDGVNVEHNHVRNSVGIFDVSHMGEFLVEGPKSTELLNYLCSNDIFLISKNKAQYNCLINDSGGIIDDLIVYKIEDEKYMLVVNAANIEKDWNWIKKQNQNFKCKLTNISDDTSLLALQGPKAEKILHKLVNFDLNELKSFSFLISNISTIEDVLISRTGYTGSGGFELYIKNEKALELYNLLINDINVKPIGLAARDTLRLEMGYCLYGNDINDNTSPIQAGLKWATKINKEFIGKKHILDQIQNGTDTKLVGFKLLERGIPRKDYNILDDNDNMIGIVSSGTMSPYLKTGVGMGYVETSKSKLGSSIFIEIRNKKIKSEIVKPPFING